MEIYKKSCPIKIQQNLLRALVLLVVFCCFSILCACYDQETLPAHTIDDPHKMVPIRAAPTWRNVGGPIPYVPTNTPSVDDSDYIEPKEIPEGSGEIIQPEIEENSEEILTEGSGDTTPDQVFLPQVYFATAIASERIHSSVNVGSARSVIVYNSIDLCAPMIAAASGGSRNLNCADLHCPNVQCPDLQCPEIPESLSCENFYVRLNSIVATYSEFRIESERICEERVNVAIGSQESTIDKVLQPWFVISMLVGVSLIMFMTLKMSKP